MLSYNTQVFENIVFTQDWYGVSSFNLVINTHGTTTYHNNNNSKKNIQSHNKTYNCKVTKIRYSK